MEVLEYKDQLKSILQAGYTYVSSISPADWCEENVIMGKPFPGPYRYSKTPYAKEIINCLAADHPAHTIVVMKGAQIGLSSGFIMPGLGWIIKNNPGNTYLSVGAPELVAPAMEKLDLMIDGAGLRQLIKPQTQRVKNNKTGDTNFKKEFPGGYIALGSANNHKNLRQVDLQFVFLDDFEAVKQSTAQSGDTLSMVKTRQASYLGKRKLALVSTPELKQTSNIEPAYLLGDQRKFLVPCPCCGVFIELLWSYEHPETKEMVGVTYQLDNDNKLIDDSVGYICQECFGFFDDRDKDVLLNKGYWKATAVPSEPGYVSFQISSLYAPHGMNDWKHYVKEYLIACPVEQPRDEKKYQTFINVCLGLTYEMEAETLSANKLSRNTRDYEIGIIPEKQSMADGNGRIVLLTCACDLNGTLEDARLDYEVLAWSETMSTYSVTHGSIGTFIPNQSAARKQKDDREKWTYEHNKPNSVWGPFQTVLDTIWEVDTSRQMKIFSTGVDTGHREKEAFEFIDKTNSIVYGLKGDKDEKYLPFSLDARTFKKAKARPNLFLVLGGKIKDDLSKYVKLKWDPINDEEQPAGFCNYPQPGGGKYTYNSYFSHYEAEQRKIESKNGNDISARWEKKNTTAQNHLWDCRVYNMVTKDILLASIFEDLKIKNAVWSDFVSLSLGAAAK